MPHAGEAAEQVVRIGLQGAEMALRIGGTGAKHLAAMIAAAMNGHEKTTGKARLASMLKSGKEQKVFAVPEGELKNFAREAKRYGVLYCVLREKEPVGDVTDILVKAEDASKINRIAEKLELATVGSGDIAAENEKSNDRRSEHVQDAQEKNPADSEKEDRLVDELLGAHLEEGKSAPENPTKAETERSLHSDSTSKTRETSEKGTSEPPRKSVRREMDEIRKRRQNAPEREAALLKRQQELGNRETESSERRTRT